MPALVVAEVVVDGGGGGVEFIIDDEGAGGVEVGAAATLSVPITENGFALPSVPSATRVMLESCRLANSGVESIASFNFILFTLKSRVRKSLANVGLFVFVVPVLPVGVAVGFVTERSGDPPIFGLIRKT